MSENNNQGWNGKTIKAPSGGGRRIEEITKEIDLGTILSLKQQQEKISEMKKSITFWHKTFDNKQKELKKKYKDLEERYRESGGLKCVRDREEIKQRIINMTECISNHEARIQNLENLLTDFPDIISMLKNLETSILANVFGENSVPNGETVFVEKPPMDERGKPHCSLQNSTPSNRIICKTCVYGEPVEYCERYKCKCYNYEKLHEKSKEPRYKQINDMITKSIDKFKEVVISSQPQKIDKKRVRDALNKCFNHTLTYKGIIQFFPNATYHIDGKDVVKLYEELGINNEN